MNKPEIEQLRFWCQYWILVAALAVFERFGDTSISWLPMYSEAKLAFFIYLWYPKTKGTAYVYDSFFRPFVAKHETAIDRSLLELRTRTGDVAVIYWQKAVNYGQTRFFEILQYITSRSTPEPQSRRPNPIQQQEIHQSVQQQKPPPPPPPTPAIPAKCQLQKLMKAGSDASPSKPPKPSRPVQADTSTLANRTSETQAMQVDTVSTSAKTEESNVQETVMDEAIRRTPGKLRK